MSTREGKRQIRRPGDDPSRGREAGHGRGAEVLPCPKKNRSPTTIVIARDAMAMSKKEGESIEKASHEAKRQPKARSSGRSL